jgi:hypothetical protein
MFANPNVDNNDIKLACSSSGGTYLYVQDTIDSDVLTKQKVNKDKTVHAKWNRLVWNMDGIGYWKAGKIPPGAIGFRIGILANYGSAKKGAGRVYLTNITADVVPK